MPGVIHLHRERASMPQLHQTNFPGNVHGRALHVDAHFWQSQCMLWQLWNIDPPKIGTTSNHLQRSAASLMDETVICYASGWLIGSRAGNEITHVIVGCLLSLKVQQALVAWQQRSVHPLELDESKWWGSFLAPYQSCVCQAKRCGKSSSRCKLFRFCKAYRVQQCQSTSATASGSMFSFNFSKKSS